MSATDANTSGATRPLPRGRYAAPREIVMADQRWRLLDAMAQVVANKGFAKTSVADVVAIAGVSRKTFYEQFNDSRACLIAAYDIAADVLLARIEESISSDSKTIEEQIVVGTTSYLQTLAEHPHFARTFLIEAIAAGNDLLIRRNAVHERFAAMLETSHKRLDPDTANKTPQIIYRACVAAINELVTASLANGPEIDIEKLSQPTIAIQLAWLAKLGGQS